MHFLDSIKQTFRTVILVADTMPTLESSEYIQSLNYDETLKKYVFGIVGFV